MDSIKELIDRLNQTDECSTIEAKKGSAIDRSIMETICAFSNEPELRGGHILLGIEKDEMSLFPFYTVTGVHDTDKLQLDLSTQCASIFNQPIRPEITVEKIGEKSVLHVFVAELPSGQKPVYFKNEGLPRGAYRRIGSSDQRCTDDDMFVFYNKEDTLDSTIVNDSSLDDISEDAVNLYRTLRSKVNPYAEELQYNDIDLLQALGCIKKLNRDFKLTYAGLLIFGKRLSHRRLLPMVRVDYVRVPGNEWVENPDERFTTVDMRGPLLELVQRTFSTIADDLPKGFLLPESELQAESIGLPTRVLREAIVNAFIHRSYRENQPIQIIRYGNRLEIINPGFSLKPEEHLGEPGSKNRNPYIAAIFHETNLAETKGSGIRTMKSLMEKAKLIPPTFESNHGKNQFTTRLLLHHFLNENDLKWLSSFENLSLNENQKRALIFVKEAGAIDNSVYRQLNGVDVLKSSNELRALREKEILEQKGKSRSTYYIPGSLFEQGLKNEVTDILDKTFLSVSPSELNAPVEDSITPVDLKLKNTLPDILRVKIDFLPDRINDQSILKELLIELCAWRPLKSSELSGLLGKSEKYLLRNFISPLRESGDLEYEYPEMPNHPDQAYKTVRKLESS